MMALFYLFLPLLLAVLSSGNIPPATPPNPPQFVYRADFRAPQEIFQKGMRSHGSCENVFFHVEGKNCVEHISAFIATTDSNKVAEERIVQAKLFLDKTKESIYVYKIRADERFYYAFYSLMTAANRYLREGDPQKAQKYSKLAKDYESQKEWMAYKEIPFNMFQQATIYLRGKLNQPDKEVVYNTYRGGYVDANTLANKAAFPESTKGCPSDFSKKLKACFG